LLGTCATGLVRPAHRALREELLAQVYDFDILVQDAETNGIGPLAALHLSSLPRLPAEIRLGLLGLAARHNRASQARTRVLEDAFAALDAASIPYLLLKGIAVAHLAYARPELRAMRDVDLLLRDADIPRAETALHDAGLVQRTAAAPGRHEVVTRSRVENGFQIGIDLHRRLGMLTLPLYAAADRQTLDDLWDDSQPVTVGTRTARALGREDLLRFVFRHGFCLQLDEDRLRYVAIADAVTMLETWVDRLDFGRLRALDDVVFRGLSMLHHAVPLSQPVLEALQYRPRRTPVGIADQYWGWPRARPSLRDLDQWILATLFPPEWWLRTRYGSGPSFSGLATGWRAHLRELSAIGWRVCTGAPRPDR
jgi:hypothetical protein